MDFAKSAVTGQDRKLLLSHYAFYHALDLGSRLPTSDAQRRFVEVCRGALAPATDHEFAYIRFKKAVAAAGISQEEAANAGFVFPPQEVLNVGYDTVVSDIEVRPCSNCGRPISPERLEIIPEAELCVDCQQRNESKSSNWHVSEILCPRCVGRGLNSPLVWRTARDPNQATGYFLGCSRFPECRYIDQT